MLVWLKRFHNDESGQGLVEYLLIIALLRWRPRLA
jgi:Flp pilus assembly pilin Flp